MVFLWEGNRYFFWVHNSELSCNSLRLYCKAIVKKTFFVEGNYYSQKKRDKLSNRFSQQWNIFLYVTFIMTLNATCISPCVCRDCTLKNWRSKISKQRGRKVRRIKIKERTIKRESSKKSTWITKKAATRWRIGTEEIRVSWLDKILISDLRDSR